MKLSKNAFAAIMATACILLVIIISVAVAIFLKDREVIDDSAESSSSIEESEEESEETTGLKENYFDYIEEDEYEVIFEDQVELVTIEKEVDYESAYPAYMQELVEPWEELRASLLPVIDNIKKEQNYSEDVWLPSGVQTSNFMYEEQFICTLSTEIHYYRCIACLKEDTPEGYADVIIYRKVVVPEVG